MKIQPLYDLQQEINRLYIAGSKFAKGDPRLQKHVPVLNKLGEKAPVFKKLATDVEDLLNADMQQSAEKLMALSTLLYSILYTQGEMTETDIEVTEQVPNIDIKDVNTEYTYLQLKPVIQALTTSNSGRLELLKDALERNIFNDSRTYQYLDLSLADKYSELCYYVENTIIPKVGRPIVPFLLQNFKYEDKTEHARRFRLLSKFEPEIANEMADKILSETLPNLQVEVIDLLSNDPANEELIIKLADDKNKIVREAAYRALAKLATRTSLEKLTNVYMANKNKTNLPGIVTALASSKLPFFFQEVFNKVVDSFNEFVNVNKDADAKVITGKANHFSMVIDILENKDDTQVIEFYNRVLKDEKFNSLISKKKGQLENILYSIAHSMISNLESIGKSLEFYERNFDLLTYDYWKTPFWVDYFFKAISAGYPREKVYDLFHEAYKRNIIVSTNLFSAYTDAGNYYYYDNKEVTVFVDKIDPRWIDLLYILFSGKLKWNYSYTHALQLIHACEPAKSERFNQLVLDLVKKVQPAEAVQVFKLLMEREVESRFEIIYQAIEKVQKNTNYYYSLNRLKNIGFWTKFPDEYIGKFEKLYEKSRLDVYSDIVDEMKNNK